MKFAKLIVVGALTAFAFSTAQAAPVMSPATSIAPESAIELVQAKKKAAAKKPAAKKKVVKKKAVKKVAKKKVAKVGPGKCGTMKYWSKKDKKCASKA
jgi:uncharacterized low-complexity protein